MFRESAAVVFASVAVNLVIAGVAVLLVWWRPVLGVDWQLLAVHPDALDFQQFVALFWRGAILLAASVALGWFAGGKAAHRLAKKMRLADKGRSDGSSWWILFDEDSVPEKFVPYAGIELDDGQWFEGYVGTFSTEAQDSPDRELILVSPMKYREAELRAEPEILEGVDAVTLSASRIRFVRVTYIAEAAAKAAKAAPHTD